MCLGAYIRPPIAAPVTVDLQHFGKFPFSPTLLQHLLCGFVALGSRGNFYWMFLFMVLTWVLWLIYSYFKVFFNFFIDELKIKEIYVYVYQKRCRGHIFIAIIKKKEKCVCLIYFYSLSCEISLCTACIPMIFHGLHRKFYKLIAVWPTKKKPSPHHH